MEDNQLKTRLREKLTLYLDAHEQRKTPERYAILETIYSIEGHFEIGELYDVMLNHEKFRVSRATLYNTLELLLDANLVRRHQIGQSTQYERLFECTSHHHAICTQCGEVKEFKNDVLEKEIEQVKINRFTPSYSSLYLYGICAKCSLKQKRLNKQKSSKKIT